MRQRHAWLVGLLFAGAVASVVTLSLTQGQAPATRPTAPAPLPPSVRSAPQLTAPGEPTSNSVSPASFSPPAQPSHDQTKMPPFTRHIHVAAQNGADWLQRVQNPVTGRFMYGWIPALNVPLDGDHFLHQAEATFALARAARYFGDERCLLKARQAVLSLLAETKLDPNDPNVRCTTMPSLVVNRLAAAGLLLAAIHELRNPAADLLQQGEQLAQFIRKQQRADGSLSVTDSADDAPIAGDTERIHSYPGAALYGLMLSQRNRPAAWKLEVARQALPYYRTWWKAHPSLVFVPWQSAAWTEAYLYSREPAFAEFVFAISDWVCTLQYAAEDGRQRAWSGGFKACEDGKVCLEAPNLHSAALAESLAEACRVCRQIPDVPRYDHYRLALGQAMQFVSGLQYTEDSTRHFAVHYRSTLLGGFHSSHQDGNLRLDAHVQAVLGMIQFLEFASDR